jgi:predicted HTH transcriptional regulator
MATPSGPDSVPTIAGLLLFGRDERVAELYQRSAVTMTRFSGETPQSPVIERVKVNASLLTIFESVLKFITRYVDLSDTRPKKNGEPAGTSPIPARA